MSKMQISLFVSFLFSGVLPTSLREPPDPLKTALMARYVVHNTDWVSIGTLSTQEAIAGYPFVSLLSVSDGTKTNSTGVPYLYLTPLDFPYIDTKVDNRVSIMSSLTVTNFCKTNNYDDEDPRCARVYISGRLVKVSQSNSEFQFGMNALYERHPQMKNWPKDHNFTLMKVDIEQIELFDSFGGAKLIKPSDYFNANIGYVINQDVENSINVV